MGLETLVAGLAVGAAEFIGSVAIADVSSFVLDEEEISSINFNSLLLLILLSSKIEENFLDDLFFFYFFSLKGLDFSF